MIGILEDLLKIGIPSIVTVLVLLLTNHAAKKRQEREIQARVTFENIKTLEIKREELVVSLFSFRKVIFDFVIANKIYLSSPTIEYSQISESIKDNIPKQKENEIRIEMITHVYFDKFKDEVYNVLQFKDFLIRDFTEQDRRKQVYGMIEANALADLMVRADRLNEMEMVLIQKISSEGKSLAVTSENAKLRNHK